MYSLELCEDSLWCCNDQSGTTCCNNGVGNFTFNLLSLAPSSVTSSPGSSVTTISTVTSYVTSQPINVTGSKNSTTVLGASIGTILGVLLLGSLVSLFLVTRKLQRVRKDTGARRSVSEVPEWRAEMDTTNIVLIGAREMKQELDGRPIVVPV
jgi:hypothetical protein